MDEKILIFNLAGIGDFVESTPVLRELRRLYPHAVITLAVAEKAYALAKTCPYVNHVVGLPTWKGRSIPRLKDSLRWLRGIRSLRGRWDTAINLYRIASRGGALWMRFMLAWSGAKTITASEGGSLVSAPQRDRKPELWISGDTLRETRRWVTTLGHFPIAVFLGGERRTRHEDPERAEAWLKEIQDKWGAHPIIIGSESDPGLPVTTGVLHTDMRGKTDLEQMAAIIASSAVLITTHSAPQHFAGVWEVPTIVLVGPGDPELYHPRLDRERFRMLRNPVPCAPCYHMDCPLPATEKKKCIRGISPGAVVQAFSEIVPFSVRQ